MANWYDTPAAAAPRSLAAPQQAGSASAAYTNMLRSDWYTYMNEIGVPQEDALIRYATDPTVVSDAMQEASSDVTGAFDRQTAATGTRLASLGLSLDPEEQAAAARSTDLSRSLADVGAQNRVRDQVRARQQAIIGNPAPTIGAMR